MQTLIYSFDFSPPISKSRRGDIHLKAALGFICQAYEGILLWGTGCWREDVTGSRPQCIFHRNILLLT